MGFSDKLESIQKLSLRYASLFIYLLLITFSAIVAIKIMEYPYFLFSDQTLHFNLPGNFGFLTLPIGNGRFFPLAFSEIYVFIKMFEDLEQRAFFIYLMQAIKFVVFVPTFFHALKITAKNTIVAFCLFTLFFIVGDISYKLIPTFAHTIFLESMLLMLFGLFILFYHFAQQKDSMLFYGLALFTVNYSLYLKEPVFAAFLVFAGMNLLFYRKQLTKKEVFFQCAVGISCIVFLLSYAVFAFSEGPSYAEARVIRSIFGNLNRILFDYYYIFPVLLAFLRCFFVLFKKSKILSADIYLLMGLGYMSCFVVLNLSSSYYFLPSLFFIFVSLSSYFNELKFAQIYAQYREQIEKALPLVLSVLIVISCASALIVDAVQRHYYVKEKVVTKETLQFIKEIDMKGIAIESYLLPAEEYEFYRYYSEDSWALSRYQLFYEYLQNDTSPILQASSLEEFTKNIDNGGVGLISIDSQQLRKQLRKEHADYDFLLLDMVELVVHRDTLEQVGPLYYDFAKRLARSGSRVRRTTEDIQEAALRFTP